MLRMSQLLPVFRHGQTAVFSVRMSCNGAAKPATWLCGAVWGQVYPAAGGGTGTGGAGTAAAAGFIADVIIGITTPLSRSIA